LDGQAQQEKLSSKQMFTWFMHGPSTPRKKSRNMKTYHPLPVQLNFPFSLVFWRFASFALPFLDSRVTNETANKTTLNTVDRAFLLNKGNRFEHNAGNEYVKGEPED
jgi:hypothetical protein